MHPWVLGIGYLLPDWRGGSKKILIGTGLEKRELKLEL
jgi:hypothetical protein